MKNFEVIKFPISGEIFGECADADMELWGLHFTWVGGLAKG